jgi:hypothetical protein
VPLVELSIKTFMLNMILEKETLTSTFHPYLGLGIGMIYTDMESLETKGSAKGILGGQLLLGIAHPLSKKLASVYIGYRGVFATKKASQTFTRVMGAEGYYGDMGLIFFENGVYYNPILQEVEQAYAIQVHNVDIGFRFMF